MLASFLTFQFLCNNRSSHGNFFASFNNFSSSDIVSLTIYTYTLSISVMQISFPLSFLLFDCLRFFLTPIAGERRGGVGKEMTKQGYWGMRTICFITLKIKKTRRERKVGVFWVVRFEWVKFPSVLFGFHNKLQRTKAIFTNETSAWQHTFSEARSLICLDSAAVEQCNFCRTLSGSQPRAESSLAPVEQI